MFSKRSSSACSLEEHSRHVVMCKVHRPDSVLAVASDSINEHCANPKSLLTSALQSLHQITIVSRIACGGRTAKIFAGLVIIAAHAIAARSVAETGLAFLACDQHAWLLSRKSPGSSSWAGCDSAAQRNIGFASCRVQLRYSGHAKGRR